MSSILNASASGGLVSTGDTSANLELQSDGTTKFTVAPTGAYGTLRLETAKAWNWNGSSTNTFLDFTDTPSWAKRITVMFSGVSTSGTSNILIQIGSGSITSTGYAGSAVTFVSTPAGATSTAGFMLTQTTAAAGILHGSCVINLITTNTYTANAVLNNSNSGQGHTAAGSVTLSATLDRIRITTVNGTDIIDAGTVNICIEG